MASSQNTSVPRVIGLNRARSFLARSPIRSIAIARAARAAGARVVYDKVRLAQEFRTVQGQIGVDWRARENDTLSVGAQYRSYALPITRSVLGFNYGTGATGGATFSQGTSAANGTVTTEPADAD